MQQTFDAISLTVLCYDRYPEVYTNFDVNQNKAQRVSLLADFVQKRNKLRNLITDAEIHKQRQSISVDPIDGTSLEKEYFSKAFNAQVTGDIWEAKRYYEMVLAIDAYYPRAAEQLAEVHRMLETPRKPFIRNPAGIRRILKLKRWFKVAKSCCQFLSTKST
ncbi:MAG: hypothetical protein AAF629_25620, partial [Chloroflexota bacterium]